MAEQIAFKEEKLWTVFASMTGDNSEWSFPPDGCDKGRT